MHPLRLYSNTTLNAALCALLATCAGCWEKIEYTGPRTTATTANPKTPGAETAKSDTGAPQTSPASTNESSSPIATSTPAPTPPPVTEEAALPKPDDTQPLPPTPPVAEATPPPASPPDQPATTSATTVGDRYATTATADPPTTVAPAASTPESTAPPVTAAASPPASPPASAETPPQSATPVSESAPQTPMNSRHAAWLLGSHLSLAALANDRGVAAQKVPLWLESAQGSAKLLGTTVSGLPAPAKTDEASPASREVIKFLLDNGQRIGRDLSKQHGPAESALFEIALKSNILLLLYSPNSAAGDSIAAAITKAAPQANLPSELWQPLVDAITKKSSQADIRAAVRKMHVDVDHYLAQPAEQATK